VSSGTKIKEPMDSAAMNLLVQAALDDPRVELYSYGVQVLAVTESDVWWRSFSTETIDQGTATRDEWSKSFRYGDHMPGKHTMRLLERGAES
jgi:hypothetical protein